MTFSKMMQFPPKSLCKLAVLFVSSNLCQEELETEIHIGRGFATRKQVAKAALLRSVGRLREIWEERKADWTGAIERGSRRAFRKLPQTPEKGREGSLSWAGFRVF